ncbi:hypothetical protein PSEUDO8Z_10350 [Pseudomonas sp. 8Z]|nr:hypothetical protein PSEUDO8Z_10350 [Pseudomonas sp. 8Z]
MRNVVDKLVAPSCVAEILPLIAAWLIFEHSIKTFIHKGLTFFRGFSERLPSFPQWLWVKMWISFVRLAVGQAV